MLVGRGSDRNAAKRNDGPRWDDRATDRTTNCGSHHRRRGRSSQHHRSQRLLWNKVDQDRRRKEAAPLTRAGGAGEGLVAQPQLITHGDEVDALRTTTRAGCEPQFVKDPASSSTRSSPYDGASPGAAGTTDPRTRSESTSIRVSSLARRSGASEDLA